MTYCADHAIPFSRFMAEWSPEDREIVHMWQNEKNQTCPRCGTADHEWQDGVGWEADLWRCKGCEQIDRQHERLRDSPGSTHGLQVRLFPAKVGDG